MTAFWIIGASIIILILLAVAIFKIAERMVSIADRREESEGDYDDPYLVVSAQSVTPAKYPESTLERYEPEPAGL